MRALFVAAALFMTLALPATATAGQQCGAAPPGPDAVRKALALALKTRGVLEDSGAQVAVIGRVGSDLSRHGLRYSHAAFAVREHAKGSWLVTHMLNQCGSAQSALFDEGLGNFFLDDPFAYEAIVVLPSDAVQQRLLGALRSDLPVLLYTADYSMIANARSARYQNSNQWLLELVAGALAREGEVRDRVAAQHWLRDAGYAPSEVRISPLQRAGARMFSANVRFDDHPSEARVTGRYAVVSVESTIRFLGRIDPGMRTRLVGLD